MIIEAEEYFQHFGVPGMKWGVRRDRRIQAIRRGGTKGGPVISKVRAGSHLGPVDLVRGRGVTGGLRRKAVRMKGRRDRIKAGKATVSDQLARIGTVRITDAFPVKTANANKQTTFRSDYAMVAAGGALMTARIIARLSTAGTVG